MVPSTSFPGAGIFSAPRASAVAALAPRGTCPGFAAALGGSSLPPRQNRPAKGAGKESIPQTYPDLLRALFLLSPPALVFGGFAQDALIAGTSRREHGDVDVIVWRDELQARLADFAPLGFESFETHFELQPGRPLVIGATSRTGLSLEPTVLDREGGAPFGDLPAADGIVRVWLTPDIDTHPAVSLDGVTFKCVSPLAQYQLRAALEITGAFGDMRDRDREAQKELRMRNFSDATDEELAPRLELL